MVQRYWLFKSEPTAYSYANLEHDGLAEWDGVRNYQARNLLRDDVQEGDGVLFYHSNTTDPGVVGTAVVIRRGYPDHTAWDPGSEHPDARSTPERPIWYMVDIKPVRKLQDPVTLAMMKSIPGLRNMPLLRRGMRLSVQPVALEEWRIICQLGQTTP